MCRYSFAPVDRYRMLHFSATAERTNVFQGKDDAIVLGDPVQGQGGFTATDKRKKEGRNGKSWIGGGR